MYFYLGILKLFCCFVSVMSVIEKEKSGNYSNTLYWKCQVSGWGLVSIYWAYIVLVRDNYGWIFTCLNYIADVFTGIILTHTYRAILLKTNRNEVSLKKLLLKLIPSIIILAVLYMLLANLKWHYYWVLVRDKEYHLWISLLEWNPVFITGLRLMSIWLLAYHLYQYHKSQMAIIKTNAQLELIAKQAKLDHISAQLNPHFLFNSLNSIKSLVIENPKIARRAIDLLSDLLRAAIYQQTEERIPIKDELILVKDYIELEKLRFEERLMTKFSIDSNTENFKIPPLSIQLLVENSIKHGIDQSIEGGLISISIERIKNTVVICVLNPGTLSVKNAQKGVGLKNLKKRLQLSYKGQAQFTISEPETGFISAQLTLPILNYENL